MDRVVCEPAIQLGIDCHALHQWGQFIMAHRLRTVPDITIAGILDYTQIEWRVRCQHGLGTVTTVLFVRGHRTPEWLLVINEHFGSKCTKVSGVPRPCFCLPFIELYELFPMAVMIFMLLLYCSYLKISANVESTFDYFARFVATLRHIRALASVMCLCLSLSESQGIIRLNWLIGWYIYIHC